MKHLFTDGEMIGAIREGGWAAEKAVKRLYHEPLFWKTAQYLVGQWKGGPADVDDLLQESLWRAYDNIKNGRFHGDSTISTYVIGIMKHLAMNEQTTRKRRSEKLASLPTVDETNPTGNDALLVKEINVLLEQAMANLPKKCKAVLNLWANGYSMEEIMKQLDFENLDAAKNKKKNCMNSLRKWMLENPEKAKWLK